MNHPESIDHRSESTDNRRPRDLVLGIVLGSAANAGLWLAFVILVRHFDGPSFIADIPLFIPVLTWLILGRADVNSLTGPFATESREWRARIQRLHTWLHSGKDPESASAVRLGILAFVITALGTVVFKAVGAAGALITS